MDISVLFSINPQHCQNIVEDRKNYELRKTKPQIPTPFKGYIYCTIGGYSIYGDNKNYVTDTLHLLNKDSAKAFEKTSGLHIWNGKVIGEFVCDKIIGGYVISPWGDYIQKESALTYAEIEEYAGDKPLWAMHISNRVIYNEPKELSDFYVPCIEFNKSKVSAKCKKCSYHRDESEMCLSNLQNCVCNGMKPLTRPPQSWCYVLRHNE